MRRLSRVSAVLAVAATAVATATALTATTASATGVTNVVTPSTATAQGWYTEDGAPAYDSSAPRVDGLGQLLFNTPLASSKVNYFHNTGASRTSGVGWSAVTGLSYSVRNNSTVAQAAYDMEVLTTGTGGYTTLVWEPYQNGVPTGDGTWHTFNNLESGNWWSSHIANPNPGSQSSPQPLSFFESLYPNANVITYGVGQGSSNAGAVSYVDDVSFDGVTNNFEPDALSDCAARALHMQAPRAVILGAANNAEVPCANDVASTAAASVVLIPGINGLSALVGVANAATEYVVGSSSISAAAQTNVASVVINALGLHIVVTGLQAETNSTITSCGPAVVSGKSSIATLTVNGKKYVVGSAPLTLKLGLGVSLSLNQQIVSGNTITQRALLLTGKTGAYRTALGEAISGVAC